MFQPSFHFYKGYNIPVLRSPQDYLAHINSLPLNDTPEVFGMHPNADITYVQWFLYNTCPRLCLLTLVPCTWQLSCPVFGRHLILYLAGVPHTLLGLSTLSRYQSKTAKELLDTILNIQPKDSSGGGGETREAVVSRQAADMLEKLPPSYVPHEVPA